MNSIYIKNDIWSMQLDVFMIRLADNWKEQILPYAWPGPVSAGSLWLSASSSGSGKAKCFIAWIRKDLKNRLGFIRKKKQIYILKVFHTTDLAIFQQVSLLLCLKAFRPCLASGSNLDSKWLISSLFLACFHSFRSAKTLDFGTCMNFVFLLSP